ncbi:hypothetical protein [uncultured Treponema sp.]|uniref:hypothetical protein n=1 Tax=uncultured Treponema sp. TaxID=162155 RepID=UPI002635A81A|nr:hypothetical protein [uncultured Treponema sp.]
MSKQESQNKKHEHSFTPSGAISTASLTGSAYIRPPTNKGALGTSGILSLTDSLGAENEDNSNGSRPYKLNINASHAHSFTGTNGTTSSDGYVESRPENYTIRIWKRTA